MIAQKRTAQKQSPRLLTVVGDPRGPMVLRPYAIHYVPRQLIGIEIWRVPRQKMQRVIAFGAGHILFDVGPLVYR